MGIPKQKYYKRRDYRIIMNEKTRCQSCSMPLGQGFFGTNEDNSQNQEYCIFCYRAGNFTNPDLTIQGMIEESVKHMNSRLKIPADEARKLSEETIPQLKRWKKE